jgi:arylsulfatase A-like enzyme
VIYTSDHSEALGEAANAATLGHGDQITPDLVYVSVIFAGAGLPDVDLDALLSGIDVAPTALAALGRSGHRENGDTVNWHVDGQNCWTGTPGDRLLRSERWVTYDAIGLGELDRYRATSVWDADGGIVFQQGSRLARVGLAVGNEFGKPPWAYLTRDARRPDWWLTPPRGGTPPGGSGTAIPDSLPMKPGPRPNRSASRLSPIPPRQALTVSSSASSATRSEEHDSHT